MILHLSCKEPRIEAEAEMRSAAGEIARDSIARPPLSAGGSFSFLRRRTTTTSAEIRPAGAAGGFAHPCRKGRPPAAAAPGIAASVAAGTGLALPPPIGNDSRGDGGRRGRYEGILSAFLA
jgi:hypothetical protein